MTTLRRGEVYWADLDPIRGHEQAGHRPVLILSSTRSNTFNKLSIALPITGSRPRLQYPYTMPLRSIAMERDSWILIRQIRTLSEERMLERIGRVSNEELKSVVEALLTHLLPPINSVAIGDYPGLG